MILCIGTIPLLYEEPIPSLAKKQEVIKNLFTYNKQTIMHDA